MTGKKRSSRTNRKDPVRRPIPPAAERPAPAPRSSSSSGPMMPAFETSPMYQKLVNPALPIDGLPLHALLTIIHQDMSGQRINACVPICYQIVGALGLLGFEAEVMAAHVTVFNDHHGTRPIAELGTTGPPVVRPDGTTNGHTVVWASAFSRLADPTVVQERHLHRAARNNPALSTPAVLPVASYDLLVNRQPSTLRGEYLVSWQVFPQWTTALDPILAGDVGEALAFGVPAMAHAGLNLLRSLGEFRDITPLSSLYPHLGDLLAGRSVLPTVPDAPPEAFFRVLAR